MAADDDGGSAVVLVDKLSLVLVLGLVLALLLAGADELVDDMIGENLGVCPTETEDAD